MVFPFSQNRCQVSGFRCQWLAQQTLNISIAEKYLLVNIPEVNHI